MVGNKEALEEGISQMMRKKKPSDNWTLTWEDNLSPQEEIYTENAFGRFTCSSLTCRRKWASAHVLILFCMKLQMWSLGARRGSVKARICGQQCKRCGSGIDEGPDFDTENIDVILHNLQIRIRLDCYHERVSDELWLPDVKGTLIGRHQSELCEGCRLGLVSHSRRPSEGNASNQLYKEQVFTSRQSLIYKNTPTSVWDCLSCCRILLFALLMIIAILFVTIILPK